MAQEIDVAIIADIDEEDDDLESVDTNGFTEWENEPSVGDLKQDLTDALPDHDEHVADVDRWLDNLNIEGAAKIKKRKGHSSIVPKLIRKQAEWRYSALSEPFLSSPDIFTVSPATAQDKEAAIQNGLVLNNQFNTKIGKTKFFDEYVRAAVDEGSVIVKVAWNSEEKEVEVEVPDFDFVPNEDPRILQVLQAVQQNPEALEQLPPIMQQAVQASQEAGIPMMPRQIGTKLETQTKVIKNEPDLEVCHYSNTIMDPTAHGDMSKASFVIYRFETSKSELEKADKYKNLDDININASDIIGDPYSQLSDDTTFNFSDEPRKKFIAHEYWGFWDISGEGVVEPIIATWVGDVMIRMERNPFPDEAIPFVVVQYLPVRKKNFGEPDGELLEDNQLVSGALMRGMIDIMGRSANGQQGVRQDALDITNKRKFDRGEDYEFNATVDPRQAFYMHTYPEIPNSAPQMLQIQTAEAESMTGVKPFGLTSENMGASTTAAATRGVLDAASKREMGILRRLAEGVVEIGRKIVAMNAVFLDEEEIVRITDSEFVPVKRDDLAGNFDITLSISTAESDNAKAQELAFMLQTTAQSMGNQFAQIILSEIARLRKMPVLAEAIESFKPEPTPAEQLEMQKLQLEIEKIKSETAENMASAQLDGAKIGTEQAKAANLQSDTDMKDLDFVEQENSTKHARDVDRIQSQSEAQAKTKVVEAMLRPPEKPGK